MIDSTGGLGAVPDRSAGSRSKSALIRRLRRVEGQVRGLQKMVDAGRDHVEILTLVAQVRGALQSVAALVFESYLVESVGAALWTEHGSDHDHLVAKTVKMFKKWAT